MAELLTDLIPFEGDRETILLWDNFTMSSGKILRRVLQRHSSSEDWHDGIAYRDLEGLFLADVSDIPHVGEIRINQILEELVTVFSVFEQEGLEGSIAPFLKLSEEVELEQDTVDIAQNLSELSAAIEEAFNDYREIDERTRVVLHGRNPALMRISRTLDDIAQDFGVTRERIRQIESKYSDLRLGSPKTENACLENLVSTLEEVDDEESFILSAEEKGLLGDASISIAKLKAMINICELDDYLARVQAVEELWDVASQAKGELSELARKARSKFGLIDLNYFKMQTNVSDIQAFEAIKKEYPRSIMKGNLVLARTSKLDTAFENAIGKQLLVFGELEAENLLVGIERQASYRQVSLSGTHLEQIALIKEIAGNSPNYETYKENTISEPELSDTDVWLLEQFQESTTGMLHRNEITAASIRDSKNVNSIGVFLLFNTLIRPVGVAVMALANIPIDAETARQYANIARAAEDKSYLDYSFEGDKILLSIRPNLNTVAAGVLFPTADLRAMINDKVFSVCCSCNKLDTQQQLRLRPPSFWTGFTSAIKHAMNDHNFSKNDEFKIMLDFDTLEATFLAD